MVGKNAELEKARAQGRYMKPFETDILKLRADELNYTLCLFVKEVKKPNGEVYAPDSILYLTLGIQVGHQQQLLTWAALSRSLSPIFNLLLSERYAVHVTKLSCFQTKVQRTKMNINAFRAIADMPKNNLGLFYPKQ